MSTLKGAVHLLTIILIPLLSLSIIIRKYNKNLELIYLIFIFFSYVLGYIFDLYNKIYYFDTIVHSMFGLVSSIYALPLLNLFKKYNLNNKRFNIFFIVLFTLALSAFWEIIEFSSDKIFNTNMQINLDNVMRDIISALVFSIIYIIFTINNYTLTSKLFINKT